MGICDLPIQLRVAKVLKEEHLVMGTAESCTGGKIASLITSVSGSSEYFAGGVVSYSNEVKRNVLGVAEADLEAFGAVSQPVVEQMARGAMRVLGCDCVVATSGVAGPKGGTRSKPVGMVWIAVAYKERILSECYRFGKNPRWMNISLSTEAALEMLLKVIREEGTIA
ncbi:MAG: CinA family protein [Parabacteroides sp.]|nr:CinA family protein [Parabacteroides sp.]